MLKWASMTKVVDQEYDEETDTWVARVNGKQLVGKTPRQLRGEITRATGTAEVEIRTKVPPERQQRLNSIAKALKAANGHLHEYETRIDKVNVERLTLIEELKAERLPVDAIAELLKLHPSRVLVLDDPRSALGKRIRQVREGRIPAGHRERDKDDE